MANVLIIDDDQLVCKLLARIISNLGHLAESRGSLQAGLAELAIKPYDVVFLDVHLPDGSGLDVIAHIRARESAPEVVIITGMGDPDGAELAIKGGAWDYIQKPLSPQMLNCVPPCICRCPSGKKR